MKHLRRTNIFVLLVFLLQPIMIILLSLLLLTYNFKLTFAQELLISQSLFILIPALIFFALSGKENPCKRLKFRKLSLKQVTLLFGISFCTIPITMLIRFVTSLFVSTPIAESLDTASMSYPYVIMMLLVAIIPAISEELFVRGILFSNYKQINLRTAILLSSFIFGMLHFNFDQFFYATVLGVILALVYEFTENLIAPMIVHFAINGTSVSLMYLVNSAKLALEKAAVETPDLVPNVETISPTIPIQAYLTAILLLVGFSFIAIKILYKILKYFAMTTNKLDIFLSLFKGKPQVSLKSLIRHWPICLSILVFLVYSILIELV